MGLLPHLDAILISHVEYFPAANKKPVSDGTPKKDTLTLTDVGRETGEASSLHTCNAAQGKALPYLMVFQTPGGGLHTVDPPEVSSRGLILWASRGRKSDRRSGFFSLGTRTIACTSFT